MKLDFADLKNRWRARAVLAISIESGRIAIDVVRSEPGAATQAGRATHAAQTTQAAQARRAAAVRACTLELGADSLLANPEQAGLQLAALLAAENIRERRCVVCIPAPWALTTSADVPAISGEDLRGYLELRAEREFPIPVADLRLAHCAYALPGGKAQLTLAAVATKRLGALDRMLQSAGCQAVSISLGLDDCLQPAQPAALHFLANGDHVALVIAAGDGVAALRTLPGAVASEAAEFDQAGFAREVRITLGRLPETLRDQIHSARFGGARAPAQRLFNYLEKPLLSMGIEARFSEGRLSEGAPDPQGAGAARLAAIKHLAGQALAFEFVEAQTNRWQLMATKFDSRRRRWMIAAGAGVLLAIVGTFLIRSSMEIVLRIRVGTSAEMLPQTARRSACPTRVRRVRAPM